MKRYDVIIIGAGPAGLSAAAECGKRGMKTIVFDENKRPGGQLFKQIHKFFGSKEHKAKIRGMNIGKELLEEAEKNGAEIVLGATVTGIFPERCVSVVINEELVTLRGNSIIVATGAAERMIPFKGWTLPGVMGAGAAQTMMNINGICPGNRVLMVGSGNVGLVVSYQLIQAGCEVVAIIDAAPRVGGYGVHASKLARMGVPFYLKNTIVKAEGTEHVTGAVIAEVDNNFKVIEGTQKELAVDVICLAVGFNPMSQLIRMIGAEMTDKGGLVPISDDSGKTSIDGIFVAGDVSGIEEASSAMVEGHIAGISAAEYAGFADKEELRTKLEEYEKSLQKLRDGMFCVANKGRTDLVETEEGYPLSQTLLKKGYITTEEAKMFPGFTECKIEGIHPVIECTQNIPCNPCQSACKCGCIMVGEKITTLPSVDIDKKCIDCGMCAASCSGQAIFLVNNDCGNGIAEITLPYEFLPVPKEGIKGKALDRSGAVICDAVITRVRTAPAFDKTVLLTMAVPKEFADDARFFK